MPTTTVFTPYVAASLNGVPISGVRKARVISSFTDPVTKLYVTAYPAVSWNEGDTLTVTLGSGTNNILCGTGTVFEGDYLNTGATFELVARGPLIQAQRFRNNVTNGLTLGDLVGGPATDEVIARAVLDRAGVTFNIADIGGTGITRGVSAPDAYTWHQGETALAYLVRLSKASLGWRMIEAIDGTVKRIQVYGRPQATPQFSLNEGVDIFGGAHTQKDSFGRYTAVTVTGYDYQDGNGPVSFSTPDPIPDGVEPYIYPSTMIERARELDPGGGISAEMVALNFVEPEVNRQLIRVSTLRTPRDDVFSPGQTHQINSSLLGLSNELLWLYGVVRECDGTWFTQTLDYTGGGTPLVVPSGVQFTTQVPPAAPGRMRDYTQIATLLPELIGQDRFYAGPGKAIAYDVELPPGSRRRLPDYTQATGHPPLP